MGGKPRAKAAPIRTMEEFKLRFTPSLAEPMSPEAANEFLRELAAAMGVDYEPPPVEVGAGLDYKHIAEELASRVVWAVKFMQPKSGNGTVWLGRPDGHGSTRWWADWFFDALDECGYVVDREAYYKQRKGRR